MKQGLRRAPLVALYVAAVLGPSSEPAKTAEDHRRDGEEIDAIEAGTYDEWLRENGHLPASTPEGEEGSR